MLKKKLWDLRAISHYEMAKFRGVDTGTKTFKLFLQNVILKEFCRICLPSVHDNFMLK